MSPPRTPREVLLEKLREFGTRHKDSPQIQRAIDALTAEIKSDAHARIALRAWKVGVFEGAVELATQWQRALLAGADRIEGGKRGAEGRHRASEARHQEWRERYNYHAAKQPQATRKILCDIVAEEFGVTRQTIAAVVKNPSPGRRGRPRKH